MLDSSDQIGVGRPTLRHRTADYVERRIPHLAGDKPLNQSNPGPAVLGRLSEIAGDDNLPAEQFGNRHQVVGESGERFVVETLSDLAEPIDQVNQ